MRASIALVFCVQGFAQAGEKKADLLSLPLRVSLEWNELVNPRAASILVNDGFKLSGGTENLKLQFSTQGPGLLAGRRFQWLPAGYRIGEFGLSRGWGSIRGFRSFGWNPALVRAGSGRRIAGAGVEMPRLLFGMRLGVSILHASSEREAGVSQVGLALAREWKGGARLQAEWAGSPLAHASPAPGMQAAHPARMGGGWMVKFDGTPARTRVGLVLVGRGEGPANPAVASYMPAGRDLRIDVRRKFGGHEFLYGGRAEGRRALSVQGLGARSVREDTFVWAWSPGRLPRLAASLYWSRQAAAGSAEQESGTRLSVSRSTRRFGAGITLLRARRSQLFSMRPLWRRTSLSGEVSVEMGKGRRLQVRYETGRMLPAGLLQPLNSYALKADTRLELLGGRLSLLPVLDLAGQRGGSPASGMMVMRASLAARIKPPRWFPATEWLVQLASNHARTGDCFRSSRTDLVFRWNYKK